MSYPTIEFIAPGRLLSMNDRQHWRSKATATKAWRWRTHSAVLVGWQLAPCTVTVELPVRDNRRRDPHNYFATVKPIIDGLVDAGLWPDDTPEWVTTTEPRLVVRRDGLVRVVLVPRNAVETLGAGEGTETPKRARKRAQTKVSVEVTES